MPIASSDIVFRYSTTAGSAGDSTAGTGAGSLGKYAANNAITTAVLNNLWDDVTGAEASAGDVEYRCVFILNNHATLTLINPNIYITSQTAGGGTIDIGLDTTAISAKGSATAQAVTIANEATAPSGVTFSSPTSGSPLALGADLAPGQVKGIWIRRTVTAGASAVNPDGAIIGWGGDTNA